MSKRSDRKYKQANWWPIIIFLGIGGAALLLINLLSGCVIPNGYVLVPPTGAIVKTNGLQSTITYDFSQEKFIVTNPDGGQVILYLEKSSGLHRYNVPLFSGAILSRTTIEFDYVWCGSNMYYQVPSLIPTGTPTPQK